MKIPDDPRTRALFRADLRAPVQQTIGLIKVRRFRHIRGNHFIVLSHLGDAVHLYRQQDRNPVVLQFARQRNRLRPAPAHPIDDDPRPLLRAVGELSLARLAQYFQDLPVRLFPVPVFKDFHIHAGRIGIAKSPRHLHRTVYPVGVPNKPAHKPDHDGRRSVVLPVSGVFGFGHSFGARVQPAPCRSFSMNRGRRSFR